MRAAVVAEHFVNHHPFCGAAFMSTKGQNIEDVKVINRASTLRLLLANGPMSRSEIAAELSVTPATVTSICNEFLKKNLLIQHEESESQGRVGRKKFPVEMNCDYKCAVAIHITPVETSISVCNLAGKLVDSGAMTTDGSLPPETFLAQVAERCTKMLWNNRLGGDRILGVGVTILGPVNHDDGVSLKAFSIWDRPVPIARILEDELHIPVCVESNVCAMIGASLLYGELTDPNALAVQWGPGVGSALVIGGRVFKGRNYQSAEVGHNFVDGIGEKCRCGKIGCLETRLSVDAIVASLKKMLVLPDPNPLRALVQDVGMPSPATLNSYLDVSFPPWDEYLNDISFRLAVVVNNAIQLLAPDRIILFGELFSNEFLLERFKRSVFAINDTIVEEMFLRSRLQPQRTYIGGVAHIVRKYLVNTGGIDEGAKVDAPFRT